VHNLPRTAAAVKALVDELRAEEADPAEVARATWKRLSYLERESVITCRWRALRRLSRSVDPELRAALRLEVGLDLVAGVRR